MTPFLCSLKGCALLLGSVTISKEDPHTHSRTQPEGRSSTPALLGLITISMSSASGEYLAQRMLYINTQNYLSLSHTHLHAVFKLYSSFKSTYMHNSAAITSASPKPLKLYETATMWTVMNAAENESTPCSPAHPTGLIPLSCL